MQLTANELGGQKLPPGFKSRPLRFFSGSGGIRGYATVERAEQEASRWLSATVVW